MKKAENIIVGVSIGDLNGIGSEVILKTFDDSRMLEFCTPVIFANVKTLSFIKKKNSSLSSRVHKAPKNPRPQPTQFCPPRNHCMHACHVF